mmetsp:Transcript_178/g.368  ORF Transcript_178/g.368 Transcript_178/m.368 type:complete len:247 (+) Transcript_178:157-897(+)
MPSCGSTMRSPTCPPARSRSELRVRGHTLRATWRSARQWLAAIPTRARSRTTSPKEVGRTSTARKPTEPTAGQAQMTWPSPTAFVGAARTIMTSRGRPLRRRASAGMGCLVRFAPCARCMRSGTVRTPIWSRGTPPPSAAAVCRRSAAAEAAAGTALRGALGPTSRRCRRSPSPCTAASTSAPSHPAPATTAWATFRFRHPSTARWAHLSGRSSPASSPRRSRSGSTCPARGNTRRSSRPSAKTSG